MSMDPRGPWPFQSFKNMNLKPYGPWNSKNIKTDAFIDPLDATGMEDGGLFNITVKKKDIGN